MRYALLGGVGLVMAAVVPAAGQQNPDTSDGWVAVCNTPKGPRIDYGTVVSLTGEPIRTGEFEVGGDSYSNVSPAFMYAGRGAETISYVWGHTKPDDMDPSLFAGDKVKTANVININPRNLVSLENYNNQTWVTTFYPEIGVVYATRHFLSDYATLGQSASAATFYMKCQFASTGH